MSDRLKLRAFLEKEEGLRLHVYDDASGAPIRPGCTVIGHPTIGIGRALDTNGISNDEAVAFFDRDVALAETLAERSLPWFALLSPARQDVIIAMIFQLGMAGVLKFKEMLRAIDEGRFELAAAHMVSSRWSTQTPARAFTLAKIFREDKYPEEKS